MNGPAERPSADLVAICDVVGPEGLLFGDGDVALQLVDASALRRLAARAKPRWSLMRSVGAVERFSATLAGHTADGFGGLVELAATDRAVRNAVAARDAQARLLLDREQASYREIGVALGISRSAAARRYPDAGTRRPGGQPAALR